MEKRVKTIPLREIKPAISEPRISQSFRIREVKTIMGGKDMFQDMHRHDFFFVLLVKKGRGNHLIDFNSFKVSDNSIFVMRPGQVHQLELKAGSTGYLVEFSKEFYHLNDRGTGHVLRKATSTNFCKLNKTSFDKLHSLLHYMFQEYNEENVGYHEVIRAQLDIFFIEFLRNRQQSQSLISKGSSYEQERLDEFVQLIETNVSTKKQVAEYADLLNLSAYQLSAITKNVLGKAPSILINEFIILESKRLLLATTDQVNQIAWHLGYEDPSYFIRFFRKHTGYSPEAFRTNSK